MRRRVFAIALVAAAGLGGVGVVRGRAVRAHAADRNAPMVVSTTAKRQDLEVFITQTGVVAAKRATPVIPDLSGRAQWVCANGIILKAGDVVLRLDPTTFQEALDDANVAYDEALLRQEQSRDVQGSRMTEMQLRLQSAQDDQAAFQRQQDVSLRQLKDSIDQGDKELAYTREDADVTRRLAGRGLVPGTEVEHDDATVKSSEFSLERSRSDYQLKTSQAASQAIDRRRNVDETTRDMSRTRDFTDRGVRMSGNQVDNVSLRRQRAQEDMEKTVIHAPVEGLMVLSPIGGWRGNTHLPRQGDFISQGRELGQIVSLAQMQVELELDQKQITGVHMGQPAQVTIEALPGTVLQGRVSAIGQTARRPPVQGWRGVSSSATFPVTIALPPTGKIMLRPGMQADVRLVAQRLRDVVVVPSSCVFRTGKQPVVFAFRGGKFVSVPVTVGVNNGDYTQIVSGLAANERIALNDLSAPGSADHNGGANGNGAKEQPGTPAPKERPA